MIYSVIALKIVIDLCTLDLYKKFNNCKFGLD